MLRIENLKKSFGARTLFQSASYHFPQGERVALVGANGAGKTTMLNIICGLDVADDGEVLVPSQVAVGYLPQKPNAEPLPTVLQECEAGALRLRLLREHMDEALIAMEQSNATGQSDTANEANHALAISRYEQAESAFRLAGGYALESKATGILRGLGFKEEDLQASPRALSGGWRMRLELARLFIREPDFLILDEPTNHLDLPSLVWVENFLQNYRGTLLFVSHDRALLNRLATVTLHLYGGKLTPYKGNFDAFLEARDQRLEQEQVALDQLKRRRESMERFVTRFGAKASKATQAQSRVKMIARIRDLEGEFESDDGEDSVMIAIPEPPKTPRIVYEIRDGAIGYSRPLATKINLSVERGRKIAVIGANGIGKSTLLKTIAAHLPALAGEFIPAPGLAIAYFAQDQTETLDPSDSVLSNLLRQTDLSEKEGRSLLGGFLFRGNDVFKKVSVLSGGEMSRLGLACALAKKAGFLLLDEPTNHLDMASVAMLVESLADYEGNALFVSHDRTFIDGICTHVFAMVADGRSMLFEGKLADYERLAAVAGFPNVLQFSPSPETSNQTANAATGVTTSGQKPTGALTQDEFKELKRLKQKLTQTIERLDRDMETTKKEAAKLEQSMAEIAPSNFSEAAALHQKHADAKERLEAAEIDWLDASEELEHVLEKLAASGRE